ncbi:MAG: phosphoribosylformylglycinamidine synthase subunit PurS [Phycisphaerales bacterium]|nr:phosphoribosylformylglycinamidine synthase subunit PurS [Phycisphaerales bacterium]
MSTASLSSVRSNPVFRIEIRSRAAGNDPRLVSRLRAAGLAGVETASASRLFFVEGEIDRTAAGEIAESLLVDPVTEAAATWSEGDAIAPEPRGAAVEVHLRPGVMDPVAASTLAELKAEGYGVESVRTAWRYRLTGSVRADELRSIAGRVLANDCIEEVVIGTAGVRPTPRPRVAAFELRHVAIRTLDESELTELSRRGHLFLNTEEMRTIQAHYQTLGRDPTDLELETIAQTWSEHCVHKTLKSRTLYQGASLPDPSTGRAQGDDGRVEIRFENLLKETIARATTELIAERRGPECLSVFKDNAGVIGFDDKWAVAFKVETHNRPSAIEPFGGAATGIGGCIRDVMGCGLGAMPIANTDVFCVAPGDWPEGALPRGVLHPARVLKGVVDGVGEYGNRMGIPTINGAVHFDPRYLGNPLVFCGCVGLIPRDKIEKQARAGDLILVIGGRTGRDGIHGATFSSAELTDTHADEFSHAVQIGNAIEEKRVLDAVIRARDAAGGCLYTAITDCGAGGLSSAVGEMGETVGAQVELESVPLKYAGLRYDEIWISEAQERMVLAVPRDRLDRFLAVMREEEVEATVIGRFGCTTATGEPRLEVRYQGTVVGDVAMAFLHQGLPRTERRGEWSPAQTPSPAPANARGDASAGSNGARAAVGERGGRAVSSLVDTLLATLARPTVASKEPIIRRYDHEVQGGSVIKSLVGRGNGPADAAVLRPRLDSRRGIAVGCGLAPQLSDIDPYWMAIAAIDEALCNVLAVGGDPAATAMLDNFCWGRCDDPRQMGGLVRTCVACYDAAKAFGVPFISGKDSLNNEFALDAGDIERLIGEVENRFAEPGAWGYPGATDGASLAAGIAERIRRTGRLSIPGTLLISAVSLVPDVRRCITPDLKAAGGELLLIGGLTVTGFALADAQRIREAVYAEMQAGTIRACHDATGGWLPALAEMCIAGDRGATLVDDVDFSDAFEPRCAAFMVETGAESAESLRRRLSGVPGTARLIARVADEATVRLGTEVVAVDRLRAAWAVR